MACDADASAHRGALCLHASAKACARILASSTPNLSCRVQVSFGIPVNNFSNADREAAKEQQRNKNFATKVM